MFCIKSSKNKINIKNKNQVINKEAHNILKIINHNIYIDNKNHCLKLDNTFERYTFHLKYIFLKK